VNQSNEDLS